MPQSYGLGRGLSSLIPQKSSLAKTDPKQSGFSKRPVSAKAKPESKVPARELDASVQMISIDSIIPNTEQPRLHFKEEMLKELADSIKQHGIIQPLIVVRKGSGFELIAGERRLRASKRVGLKEVPVVVRKYSGEQDKLELALIENIQRDDLDLIEEARAYKRLADEYSLSQAEIAVRTGKSRSGVANRMRLLSLPVEAQRALAEGKITEGHAKLILGLDNPEKQRALFELILRGKLTVRQTEEKIREVSVKPHKRRVEKDPQARELEEKLAGIFGTKVKVSGTEKSGKIVLEYYSHEELSGLLKRMTGEE
jgi:ParB family chromosome partitioning protein